MSNFSVYDRPLDASRREASIGRIFVRIPDLTPLFRLYRGDLPIQGGYFYYREGVNSPCRGAPKEGRKSPLHGSGPGYNITESLPRRED